MTQPSVKDYSDIYRLGQADAIAEVIKLVTNKLNILAPSARDGWQPALAQSQALRELLAVLKESQR